MRTAADIDGEIGQLHDIVGYLSEQKRSLEDALQPYWNGKRDLTHRIIDTYDTGEDGRILFSWTGKDDRRTLYGELLDLAEEYGDIAEQRRDVEAEIEAAQRQIKWFRQQLDYMLKKGILVL